MKKMAEQIKIVLRYEGKEVDDGTMSVDDFLPVIQGFSSAYGKLALAESPDYQHNIRIVGLEKGSADIILTVWQAITQNPQQAQALAAVGTLGITIMGSIFGVIKLIKHVKKRPYQTTISGNDIKVTNIDNQTITFPVTIFNLFKAETIAPDLAKMAKPLEDGRIQKAEFAASQDGKEIGKEVIVFEQKPYFDTETEAVTSTKETWLTGTFNSLTKTTNRGFFILQDGTRVSYELKREKPEELYPFFIVKGLVRVKCITHLDENLKVVQLDIYDVEKMQLEIGNE